MKIVKTVSGMQQLADKLRENNTNIACVPTMGYFHDGHISLMKRGKEIADVVVATLFVNPTQFAPNEDYNDYPRDPERDAKLAKEAGVDILFNPSVDEMYPAGYGTKVEIKGITDKFEGKRRPTHFSGVATVVSKLFNATKPHIAIFGQKDYQQTLVIKQLVKDLLFDIKIYIAPTQRQSDGLAMSSRNVFLTTEQRSKAGAIYEALQEAVKAVENGEKRRKVLNGIMQNIIRKAQAFQIDYASAANAENLEEPEEFHPGQKIVFLIAAFMGKTRLIDNAVCTVPSGISSKPEKFVENDI